jgi:hypothetical protein
MIKGNFSQQALLTRALDKQTSPILCVGPYGIGKCSFVMNYFNGRSLDFTLVDCEAVDIDYVSNLKMSTENSIIFDNFHALSLVSQDSLLKWCEESNNLIIFIAESVDNVCPTIMSRCRFISRWQGLADEDLSEFSDMARLLCGNSYSIAKRVDSSDFFKNYYDQMLKCDLNEFFKMLPLPKFENPDDIKTLLSCIRVISRQRSDFRNLLSLEGFIVRNKHVNLSKSIFSLLS